MSDLVYDKLAEALDRLPNGFPRTASKVEIRILKKLFSPEEAVLANQMGRTKETPDVIASRTGLAPEEASARLQKMADKDLVWNYEEKGKSRKSVV